MLGRVKNGKGLAYALLTPAFYGAGLACMLTPEESLTNVFLSARGEDCITLWRMFGASLLMLPTWTASLKVRARSDSSAACPRYMCTRAFKERCRYVSRASAKAGFCVKGP
jgi:hypothetical protein